MRGAILEVLLVSAKGIDHNRFVGMTILRTIFESVYFVHISSILYLWELLILLNIATGDPDYHVIIECGTQICRSKTSSGAYRRKAFLTSDVEFIYILVNNVCSYRRSR